MKPGDKVKVEKEGEELEGILVNDKKDEVVLKLDSGYNIGISKSKVKKITKIADGKKLDVKYKGSLKAKKDLPTIAILHTGGTIASKVDYRTGGVEMSFKPEDMVGMFPELSEIANLESELIENMWSEDMRFGHYKIMAKAIAKWVKKGVKGIILTHGTDTLGYSAAALSFMLENVPIPVLIVGAQRSSDRGSTDAAINLLCAAEFITKTDYAGVAICMHHGSSDDECAIMPACKTRKFHTSRRDAFKVVNDDYIALIHYKTKKIKWAKKPKKHDGEFSVKANMDDRVGLLKAYPNLMPDEIKFYIGYKGLVIEGTGLGQMPINKIDDLTESNKKNFDAIKDLVRSGCIVVMTSQCIFGRVNMNVYSAGRDLLAAGVTPGEDMLPETAFIKLAWLLGNYGKDAINLVGKNLRGEINERILTDEFL